MANAYEKYQQRSLASAHSKRRELDPREIVRETLAIMHECSEAFASDELLVDLVTSVIVVRLQEGRH